MEVTEFILSLGSNLGSKKDNLSKAVSFLGEVFGDPIKLSSFYGGPSWGFKSDDFVNCCVKFTTNFSCEKVLEITQEVECKVGRTSKTRADYEDRTIDIDIIFFGSEIIETPSLVVPHPRFKARNFVLFPLVELDSTLVDPKTGLSVSQLKDNSSDDSELHII